MNANPDAHPRGTASSARLHGRRRSWVPARRVTWVGASCLCVLSLVSTLPATAYAQGDILGFDVDAPDLGALLAIRPAPRDCPVGRAEDTDALPPSSHLLHLGAARFFLNHGPRLGLTPTQRGALRTIRDDATVAWSKRDEEIARTEAELWEETGAARVLLPEVDAKVGQIEHLRAVQRMEYIRAVEQAAEILDEAQRQVLLGLRSSPGGS